MVEFKTEGPLKILIEDLRNFKKLETNWAFKISEEDSITEVNKVLIQGEIIKTAGFSREILIVDDKTGKVKVTRKAHVPGDLSWLNEGMCCLIIGSLLENGKLPLISADKIAKITNPVLQEMWAWEVRELKHILMKKIIPRLPEND